MTVPWLSKPSLRLDPAVALVMSTRLALLLAAPVTLWLVATRRPVGEQGLYFIFWNIQALTQLMELGVGTLIVQFASHESPFLTWDSLGELHGDQASRLRVCQVLRDGRRWFGRVAVALTLFGGVGGAWLLRSNLAEAGVGAAAAGALTVLCTAAYLPLVPYLCVIEGCGGLIRVQRMRLFQTVISTIALWTVLLRWGALWGVAAFAIAWFATAWTWLVMRHGGLLANRSTATCAELEQHPRESPRVGAIQWKTGASWLAWWIAPQAVTPIILTTHGAAAAGQVGMSFAIATAPLTLGVAWLQARYPRYGALLASGMLEQLRRLARTATLQAALVSVSGVLGAAALVWFIGNLSPSLASRVLPAPWILVLGATNLAWLIVQSLGSYLRAWREEPLMQAAVAGAALATLGTFAAASRFSTEGAVTAYSVLVVGGVLPLAVLQFWRQHRRIGSLPS